jgi:putative transcriptional regulator
LPAAFERLERTPAEPRIESGSPAALLLEWAGDIRSIRTISAIQALHKRGMPLLRAKRSIESMLANKRAFVLVPRVESLAALVDELCLAGVTAISPDSAQVDVKGTRTGLGMTQEQFALRFGLDLDALRNWEHGRRAPDTATRSYLRAIGNDPAAIEAALWGGSDLDNATSPTVTAS